MGRVMDNKKTFHSTTYGQLSLPEVIFKIGKYIHKEPEYKYRVIVGTDSQENGKKAVDFVVALIVHRVGGGGIYFWQRERVVRKYALQERIYEEATRSLTFAQELVGEFEKEGFLGFDVEIHVDIGKVGETRAILSEVVGMIRGSGFEVKVKPEAFGASSVADRHA